MDSLKSYFPNVNMFFSIYIIIILAAGCDSTSSTGNGNRDPGPTGPSFSSGQLAPGDTYSYTFTKEGSVSYYCRNHTPNMTGRITISSSAEHSERDTVEMRNQEFIPGSITIAPDTEIIWINREEEEATNHTVTSGQPSSEDDGDDGGGY